MKEHFLPHKIRDIVSGNEPFQIVWSCQICNMIKGAHVFESGNDARNYILDRLLKTDWKIIEEK